VLTSRITCQIFWRVEATLLHAPINGVGSRMHKHSELLLMRYDTPPSLLPKHSGSETAYSKSGAPLFRYSLQSPALPVGPTDVLAIPINVRLANSNTTIRSVSIHVERRIQLYAPSQNAPYQSVSSPIPITPLSPKFNSNSSAPSSVNSMTSTAAIVPDSAYSSTALLIPSPESALVRTIKATVADAQSVTPFIKQSDGSASKTLVLPWPNARTNSRWSIGETLTSSELVSVRFYAHVKVYLTPRYLTLAPLIVHLIGFFVFICRK
jgi:hypothetical protein